MVQPWGIGDLEVAMIIPVQGAPGIREPRMMVTQRMNWEDENCLSGVVKII